MTDFKEEAEHELISTSVEVEQLDTTLFRSKSLWLPRRARGVFGGQVISQALVSATNTVDSSYAIHCYFLLSAAASKPIIYFVETSRKGRSFTTRTVKASQSGKMIFIMVCSFQKPEPGQLSHQVPFPAQVPAPEDTLLEDLRLEKLAGDLTLDSATRRWYEQAAQDRRGSPVDVRLAVERTNEEGAYVAMWWLKVRKARGMPDKFEQPFQKCILAYMSDLNFISTPARALALTRTKGPRRQTMGGSLDHSIFYYSHDIDCSEWILYMMTSPVSAHGRGAALGRMYAQSGKLVAITAQEGLVRVDPRFIEQEPAKL
ncbi:putative peroxisomal acyl-coenzyme A thioester hydrolase 1 [Ramaria rubella]|nr:putative peroxisomal acyl-coenzyme A thioester hydrolase 1 [Ramaria rubella]